jgi:hypothetical protein
MENKKKSWRKEPFEPKVINLRRFYADAPFK